MSKKFSLGRADAGRADILLSGSTISAKHAELHIDSNGILHVSDMGSSNGTNILRNGKKLNVTSQSVPLSSSDLLSLGGETFNIDELLAKIPKRSRLKPVSNAGIKGGSSVKMMRCTSCGSITPAGKTCVECGYHG